MPFLMLFLKRLKPFLMTYDAIMKLIFKPLKLFLSLFLCYYEDILKSLKPFLYHIDTI